MTPEERTGEIIRKGMADGIISDYPLARLAISVLIEQAIINAVEAERAACEEIAENEREKLLREYGALNSCAYHTVAEEIRDAIRARTEATK